MIVEFMTVSGRRIDVLDVKPADVDIEDAAHHLAWTCRYGGAVKQWYNNAQHSVLVSQILSQWTDVMPAESYQRIWCPMGGQLHDVGETYTGDLTNPMKRALRFAAELYGMQSPFDVIEDRIQAAVEEAFGLPDRSIRGPLGHNELYDLLKKADLTALAVEDSILRPYTKTEFPESVQRESLCIHHGIWERDEAKEKFLRRFHQLSSDLDPRRNVPPDRREPFGG